MIRNLAACDLYGLIKLLRGDDGIIYLWESTKQNIKISFFYNHVGDGSYKNHSRNCTSYQNDLCI